MMGIGLILLLESKARQEIQDHPEPEAWFFPFTQTVGQI